MGTSSHDPEAAGQPRRPFGRGRDFRFRTDHQRLRPRRRTEAREDGRAVGHRAGVSERNVTADLATWSVDFSHQGIELGPVQQSVDAQARAVREFFQRAGFKVEDIADSDVGLSRERPREGETGPERLTVRRSIQLRTGDVMKARAAYSRQAELLRDGVELSGTSISYTFTRLNALKPAMIAEANQNARRSAEQFARDSGASVGRIKTASQGYFSVGPRDGEACDECGSSGGTSPFQKVRVVTTIDYDLG